MDQSLLVRNGHRLLDLLDRSGLPAEVAIWFHDTNIDVWRLWIVPRGPAPDKRDFYLKLSQIVGGADPETVGVDTADVQLMRADHPAIRALSRMFRVTGMSDVPISNNMLDGFFVPEGIILRMDFQAQPSAA